MPPAPSPKGIANRQSIKIFFENENPRIATAVDNVLNATTRGVPSFLVSLALKRLEMIVPTYKTPVTKLEYDIGMSNSV